jgi:hypothetical protein
MLFPSPPAAMQLTSYFGGSKKTLAIALASVVFFKFGRQLAFSIRVIARTYNVM